MPAWTVTEPLALDPEEPVTRLRVHLYGSRLNVVGTDGPVRVEVDRAGALPLSVSVEDGLLTIRHGRPNGWP